MLASFSLERAVPESQAFLDLLSLGSWIHITTLETNNFTVYINIFILSL